MLPITSLTLQEEHCGVTRSKSNTLSCPGPQSHCGSERRDIGARCKDLAAVLPQLYIRNNFVSL